MAVTIGEFLERLETSGILDEVALAGVRAKADDLDADADRFVKTLHKAGDITGYQAQALWKDKGHKLSFGNYVIEDELGRGGMGVVLKARHKRMQRRVGIKVLPAQLTKDAEAIARFEREVVAAAQLSHTNIVGAYDADEIDGQHVLIMEYVDGQDLSSLVRMLGPLSVDRAIDCVLQAAKGLEFAHKRGVIHRDIKPANLLVDGDGTVKILDMGLARFSDAADVVTQAELTGTGTVMGTVDYMAPEQALNTKSADGRADQYSLGITLHYLLTGTPAYRGETLTARLLAHQNDPIPSLCDARSDVGEDVQAVFERMVAKAPEDRYTSMTDTVIALDNLAAGRPKPVPTDPGMRAEASIRMSGAVGSPAPTASWDGVDSAQADETVATAIREEAGFALDEQTLVGTSDSGTLPSMHRGPDGEVRVGASRPSESGSSAWYRDWRVSTAATVLVLAAIVFFVRTPNGTLRIEIDDPEVEVSVKGTTIVLKGADTKDISLEPGKHVLHVTRGDFAFDTESLALKKGETVVVKVELVEGVVQVARGDNVIGSSGRPARAPRIGGGIETDRSDSPPPAIAPFVAASAYQDAWARHLGEPVVTTNSIGMKLAVVPPGSFKMGQAPKTVDVTLTKPFRIGVHEVTQGQWTAVMGTAPWKGESQTQTGEKVAATFVSWTAATEFCRKLTDRERVAGTLPKGWEYRLPTHAEWEFACRAGTTTAFSFGDDESKLGEYAWFDPNTRKAGAAYAQEVGEKKPNPWGLFDMHGNVWEWCSHPYAEELVGGRDPQGPTKGSRMALGGGWRRSPASLRSGRRQSGVDPSYADMDMGFRVVLSPAEMEPDTRGIADPEAPVKAVSPFDAATAKAHQEAWAKHFGEPVVTTNSIGIKLAIIPPGRFKMGEADTAADVTLTKPFRLGIYEVTQGQWKSVVGTEPWKGQKGVQEGENVAATFVSWTEATDFCRKLTEREREAGQLRGGWEYRLPTEAEWEWACRAGTTTRYSFGDDVSQLGEYAWFGTNKKDAGAAFAHAVGLKKPNSWGLHDTHGNVHEWCSDWEGDALPRGTDPIGPQEGTARVHRGGSWYDNAGFCRSVNRFRRDPSHRRDNQGFRVVLKEPPPLTAAPFGKTRARAHQQLWARHLGEPVVTTNSIGVKLAIIPPGRFKMGEADTAVDVTLTKPFRLGIHEVTQGQWKSVMGTEPWKGKVQAQEGRNFAATLVDWAEATEFCRKLTEREQMGGKLRDGWEYRLPTEVEWEYACRAGTTTAFSFGDDELLLGDYAWFDSNTKKSGEAYAHEVGLKRANPWGLYDVHGNVWELCSDWYGVSLPGTDPAGPTKGSKRVRRGGGWHNPAERCRSAFRDGGEPSYRSLYLGFRLALSPSGQ